MAVTESTIDEAGAVLGSVSYRICDVAGLLERCLDDRELASGLVEKFATRLQGRVREIERALLAADWPAATAAAHSVKGEAGSLAVVALHAAANRLEHSLRSGRTGEAAADYACLRQAADEFLKSRSAILKRLGHSSSNSPQCR